MSLSVKHNENLHYLHIEVSGKWSHEDSRKIVNEISSHLSPGHKGRVLIDTREQGLAESTLAIYNEAREMASSLLDDGLRVAILTSPGIHQTGVFFETVARNRGVDLMVFHALHDAGAWLTGDTATHSTDTDHT